MVWPAPESSSTTFVASKQVLQLGIKYHQLITLLGLNKGWPSTYTKYLDGLDMALATDMLISTTVTLTPVVIRSGCMSRSDIVVWRAYPTHHSIRYADEAFFVALSAAGSPDFIAGKAFQIDLLWRSQSGLRPNNVCRSIFSARHMCGPLKLTFPITTSTSLFQRFRARVPQLLTSASRINTDDADWLTTLAGWWLIGPTARGVTEQQGMVASGSWASRRGGGFRPLFDGGVVDGLLWRGADAPPQPERLQLKAGSFSSTRGCSYVLLQRRRTAAQYLVTDCDTLAVVMGPRSPAPFVPVFLLTFTMLFLYSSGIIAHAEGSDMGPRRLPLNLCCAMCDSLGMHRPIVVPSTAIDVSISDANVFSL